MPIVGFGLHFLLALCCAVHAVRSGQPLYWLFILFAFPLLGSIVYFFAIFLPHSRLQRGARRAVSVAARAIDPQRDVREARAAYEDTPTAQNRMRLANALLEVGQPDDALTEYEACLAGPFANDVDIRFGAARAAVESGRFARAVQLLEPLRQERADYRPDTLALLLARAYAGTDRGAEARAEFERAVERFGTFEAKAEFAIWAYTVGDLERAERLQADLDQIARKWNRMTRELNAPVERRLRAARDGAARRA